MGESTPLDITAIVITSPFVSMPSTAIISYAIDSFDLIQGLESAPVLIVMDGCRIGSETRAKKGIIKEDLLPLYDQYHAALLDQFKPPRFTIIRSDQHLGFAHAVKLGLESCMTKFALVAQHDRYFCESFLRLNELLEAMNEHAHIRYIGFPTSNSISHDRSIHARYHLNNLNRPEVKLDLGDHLYLQPLVFWFDSQHICHVQRYLEIYKPFRNFPQHLRDVVGMSCLKEMVMKPGDFIEDKFGQVQRNLLARLRAEGHSDALINEVFKWFGSYLCWVNHGPYPFNVEAEPDKCSTLMMVSHLDGRKFDLNKIEQFAQHFGSEKLRNRTYLILKGAGECEEVACEGLGPVQLH